MLLLTDYGAALCYLPPRLLGKDSPIVSFLPDALDAFLAAEDNEPVVMLNLIRFEPDGGRDRYSEYLRMAEPILARFGAKILFKGDGLAVLTTGSGQPWDAVVLVR